ncbi:MAG: hybrid sensor histidine kinase/response regulator [Bacteroidota bacterium]
MEITLRVLCLEDDEEDYDFTKEILENAGFSLTSLRVHTRESFIQALPAFKPDVILSDHALPMFDSTEALVIAKANYPDIPFILVTGAMSDEFAVKSLKLGADDYVLKSSMARLPSVIENALKQKDAERAKRKAAKELAKRNDELSKINRELDSFVYSVSHNLRAPLMSVLGLVNLAKQEKDFSSLATYLQMMEQSILKLDTTLKDILEYSRNARQDVKQELVDFSKILDENLQKMQFMPGFKDIEKIVEIKSDSIFYADEYRLSVIFNNLISNSIKYADRTKEKNKIYISIRADEKKAVIEFSDNGIGISKELQPRIFDMFFRATQSKEGAGLGLYIVREAIEMLNGTIRIESELGEGTRFLVEIPNGLEQKTEEIKSMLVDRG